MNRPLYIVLIVIILNLSFSPSGVCASAQYRGQISMTLVEPNKHIFSGMVADSPVEAKSFFALRQTSGQKFSVAQQQLLFDNTRQAKYHVIVELLAQSDDQVEALVKLYHNSMTTQTGAKAQMNSQLVSQQRVTSVLNQVNKYQFVEDGIPNIYLTIHIDKEFTKSEVIERFRERGLYPTN